MIEASRELLSPREDVWALVAEPYHLPDWWPAYQGVQPDRRGLAPNARWQVRRSRAPGFLRRPGGQGVIVIRRVLRASELTWYDVTQGFEAGVRLMSPTPGRTLATAYVDGSWWRLVLEGARGLPRQAVERLYDLCQTSVSLREPEV